MLWSIFQVVNLGQHGMPAKSMVLVRDNKELWVGCGNKIVIVDTSTLVLLDEIAVYQTPRTHVRIMVTDGSRVWSADRRSPKILQWDVSSRQLTNIFDCDSDSPVGAVLSTNVKEPRRFSTGTGSARRNSPVSDPPDIPNPSYTEAMFREAMASQGNPEGDGRGSMRRDESLPREFALSSSISPKVGRSGTLESSENGDSISSNQSPPVTIPGSQAKFFSEKEKEESILSRFRSLLAETDTSGDSGVSSFRSTNTTKSNAANPNTSTTAGAIRGPAEDSRTDSDSTSVTSGDVPSVRMSVDLSGSSKEQERESSVGATSKDKTSDESSVIPAAESGQSRDQEIRITLDTESDSTSNIAKDRNETQQNLGENNSRKQTDDVREDAGDSKDHDQGESEFELVDREESRQAFIEGRRRSAHVDSASTQQCASMASLQLSFSSSTTRAPSLMSSKRRKSQRRQANEENKSPPPKPWAARPRLRILAGSINRVTSLLLVNGSLWIGRGAGDVLTVNVNSANNDLPLGYVFAQLESDNLLGYENGQVDEIVNSGTNKVVCLRRLEPTRQNSASEDRFTERYQIIVWEAWGDLEFRKFRRQLNEFNALVE